MGDGGERERAREGGGAGGIQPVPIVATVQLHLSQQRRDYFYKAFATRRARRRRNPGLKEREKQKETKREKPSLESTSAIKVEKTVLFFSFSFGDTNPAPRRSLPEPKLHGLTSAKCELRRPVSKPPPQPWLSAHLLAGWHCYRYTGRIYELSGGGG